MGESKLELVQRVSLVLGVGIATLIFLHSPGTIDVTTWSKWANILNTYGLVDGFKIIHADYPPLTSVILLFAFRLSQLFRVEVFGGIKLTIAAFLFLSSFIFWLWTRDLVITVLLHVSLLLNSVALGYIDIFFTPALIFSIWALKERRLALSTCAFSIAIFIKWQPIIIAPFFALCILNITQVNQLRQIEFKRLFREVLFPAITIVILTFSIFGILPVMSAFEASVSQNYMFLSGNALNLNWLITHLMHVFYPDLYGGLIDGRGDNIITTSANITLISRLLFYLSYTITLVSFFKREKSFENFILFSLLGYWTYFIFNIGVHENHLFIATILSIVLFWTNKKYLFLAIILIVVSNLNLFVFYGIDGLGLRFNRAIGHRVDTALLISVFNIAIFSFYWVTNVLIDSNSANIQQ